MRTVDRSRWNVQYMQKVLSYDPIAYWMQDEKQGTVANDISRNERHGAYTSVTLGQAGIGDSRTAPFYDGANSYLNCSSASMIAAMPSQVGSLMLWLRVFNAGVWTDGTNRFVLFFSVVGDDDYISIGKPINNTLRCRYTGNGTIKTVDVATTLTTWFCVHLTWTVPGDEFKVYLNGVQQGATQNGLVGWDEALNISVIGALNLVPTNEWHGYVAHAAFWSYVLTQPQCADLATV